MSRPTIFAEQLTDPTVAAALFEHREDRSALLASLTRSLENDPRVRAAWLWGSFGRNEADDLSDLDPWIIVADEAVAEMGPRLRLYAERTGSFVSGGEKPKNGPPGGGYFGSLHQGRHGLLHIDCYWQAESAAYIILEQGLLFDRLHQTAVQPEMPSETEIPSEIKLEVMPAITNPETDGRIEGGLGFAWLMFSIAAKYLARDPASDLGLMFYPKPGLEEAAAQLRQAELFQPEDWAVPAKPLEKVDRLRHLVDKTEQLRLIANAQGCTLSPAYTPCLFRYLDMVEGILR